jgi:hypothetical protein
MRPIKNTGEHSSPSHQGVRGIPFHSFVEWENKTKKHLKGHGPWHPMEKEQVLKLFASDANSRNIDLKHKVVIDTSSDLVEA